MIRSLMLAVVAAVPPAVLSAPMTFTGQASSAGITHGHLLANVVALGMNQQVAWMPGGAVAEDFDGDGLIDLYVLQSGPGPNLLYINCGDGTFKEEAAARGAALSHVGVGASAADFDNDGDIDICATSLKAPHYVLENDGTGHFSVCVELDFPVDLVMSPSWGDLNNDGQLDLLIGRWQTNTKLAHYWNLGNASFQRTTPITGDFIYSPVFADVNADLRSDLLIVSDFLSTKFYRNQGVNSYSLIGSGSDENGMGAAVGDYDNDGDLDLFVSSIKDEDGPNGFGWGVSGNRLYRNDGGTFTDVTAVAGVRDGYWGWGAAFADFDLDGDLDLFHVNGWPETFDDFGFTSPYPEFGETPARLYENLGNGTFQEVAAAAGVDDRGQGRAVAVFDLENDGDLDIFIANNQDSSVNGSGDLQSAPGTPRLLRNDTAHTNHWLKVRLAGEPPLHRDGIGSRVYVTTGTLTQMRELNASTGFLGHGPNRIAHFGLGGATVVDQLRTKWTNGDEVQLPGIAADQKLVVDSPRGEVSPRRVAPGGSVTMTADLADYPGAVFLQWTIDGNAQPNPATVSFATAGEKQVRLDIYDGIASLARTELFRVDVVQPPLDTDGDKMPDAWEMSFGLNKNDPSDAALDRDKDGQSNLAEYLAGTSPVDRRSVLALSGARHPKGMKLTWTSVLGKRYRLEQSTDMLTWTMHPSWTAPVPGVGGQCSVIVPVGPGTAGLRLAVVPD